MGHEEVVVFLEFVKSAVIVSLNSNFCISLVFLEAWCLCIYGSRIVGCKKHVATESCGRPGKKGPKSEVLSMNIGHPISRSLNSSYDVIANIFIASRTCTLRFFDYRLILDETTTTPDLVDQNILYAKIMIKPARAIEYIAIDFVVASSGASFED